MPRFAWGGSGEKDPEEKQSDCNHGITSSPSRLAVSELAAAAAVSELAARVVALGICPNH